jgi:hypothetical protein
MTTTATAPITAHVGTLVFMCHTRNRKEGPESNRTPGPPPTVPYWRLSHMPYGQQYAVSGSVASACASVVG